MRIRFEASVLLLLITASLALASSSDPPQLKIDLTGKWKWVMQRPNGGGREVILTLDQQGEKLTGSISGMGFGGDADIQDGTFKDGQISFKVVRARGGQEMTTTYTGKVQGDTIKGKVETEMRGQKVPRDWEAQRVHDDPPDQDNK